MRGELIDGTTYAVYGYVRGERARDVRGERAHNIAGVRGERVRAQHGDVSDKCGAAIVRDVDR